MSFGTAIKACFGKYATFSGRARRSEFWWFYLFLQLVNIPFSIAFFVAYFAALEPVFTAASLGIEPDLGDVDWGPLVGAYALLIAVNLVFTIPYLAVSARRLHDTGQTANWLWLHLVGLGIVPLIMCIFDTQPGANQWGPDPKAAERGQPYGMGGGYPPPPGSV